MAYDPTVQRFMQTDPMEYMDNLNLYEPDLTNPLNRVDPMGLSSTTQPAPATQSSDDLVLQVGVFKKRELNSHFVGGVEYMVWISIKNKKANGWIVQHHTRIITVYDAAGDKVKKTENAGNDEYWEAWEVVDGIVYNGAKKTADDWPASDTYNTAMEKICTKGEIDMTGKMKFIADPNYTKGWEIGKIESAGNLPATRTKPRDWTDDGAKDHNMSIKWDDTPTAKEKGEIYIVPPGKRVKI